MNNDNKVFEISVITLGILIIVDVISYIFIPNYAGSIQDEAFAMIRYAILVYIVVGGIFMYDRQDVVWDILLAILMGVTIIVSHVSPEWVGSDGWKILTVIDVVLIMRMMISQFVPHCKKKNKNN